ncbi:hypothetical protein BDW67DRAFT_185234 [Aspergillus spinulosporus]
MLLAVFGLVQSATYYLQLKKSVDETTPNCGSSKLVISVPTRRPLPIVLHLPLVYEDKNGPYVYVQQIRMGLATGVSPPVIATSTTYGASNLMPKKQAIQAQIERLMITATCVSDGVRYEVDLSGMGDIATNARQLSTVCYVSGTFIRW